MRVRARGAERRAGPARIAGRRCANRKRHWRRSQAASASGPGWIVAALAFGSTVSAAAAAPIRQIPDPPTAAMEPQVAEKIARLRERVADDRQSAAAWGRLGRTFHAHGLEEEAAAAYQTAGGLDPHDFQWPYLLAAVLRDFHPEAAFAAVEEAARRNPAYVPTHLLGAGLIERAGNAEAALARYREAALLDPGSAAARLGIGRLLMGQGDLGEAGEQLERAAALEPRAAPIHAALAGLHMRRGHREKAAAASALVADLPAEVPAADPVLEAVWEEAVSSRGYQRRALRAESAGDRARARSLYEQLLELRPDAPDIRYNFGNFHVRGGRYLEAAAEFEQALALRPDHLAARVNLGAALAAVGRLEAARGHLEAALAQRPSDPEAHRTLAGLAAYRGDNRQAIRHYRAVLETTPDDPAIHRDLAIVLAAEGEFAAALPHARKAQELGAELPPGLLLRLEAARPEPGEAIPARDGRPAASAAGLRLNGNAERSPRSAGAPTGRTGHHRSGPCQENRAAWPCLRVASSPWTKSRGIRPAMHPG